METILIALALAAALAAAIGAWRKPPAASGIGAAELDERLAGVERRLNEQLERVRSAGAESSRQFLADVASSIATARSAQDERLARLDGAMREVAESAAKTSGELKTALAQGFQSGQKDLADAAVASQGAQNERLSKLEASLRDQTAALAKGMGDLKSSISDGFAAGQRNLSESAAAAQRSQADGLAKMETSLRDLIASFKAAIGELRTAQSEAARQQSEAQAKAFAELTRSMSEATQKLGKAQADAFGALQANVQTQLDTMRTQNEAKLDQIRGTVEEKLQKTLDERLGESFRQVSERLEQVHTGLGEMKSLASGVGDLRRVLTNVRSRGSFGEVQLERLLEQVLSPGQYAKNVATVPGSGERVEFAIVFPGRGTEGDPAYLPIDAKFPTEDYLRLQDAYDAADTPAIDAARSALANRLLLEGQKIHAKYVSPPSTLDFAILFLPTEGLFAEALRLGDTIDTLQSKHHVTVAGPTTLYALLNSFRMGFNTLAIEKRSSEIRRLLGAVKTEFGKFKDAFVAAQKSIREADKKLDSLVGTRMNVMTRSLREVEQLPEAEARLMLPESSATDEEE